MEIKEQIKSVITKTSIRVIFVMTEMTHIRSGLSAPLFLQLLIAHGFVLSQHLVRMNVCFSFN
jgi:hypothetical protein